MNARLLYRIASILLILFAAGHTFGFLTLQPPSSEARAVADAMNQVRFPVGSATFSYGGFYTGFGLMLTAYLLFSAYLAWYLGSLTRTAPAAVGALGWVFCAVQLASLVLSWIYFPAAPATLSTLVVISLGWAAWLVQAG